MISSSNYNQNSAVCSCYRTCCCQLLKENNSYSKSSFSVLRQLNRFLSCISAVLSPHKCKCTVSSPRLLFSSTVNLLIFQPTVVDVHNCIFSALFRYFWTDLPPPATRDRPPGCKTVFVGGLPENATEQLIVEVFGQCGDITAIRKSKKNFCHIRFAEEFTVDKALFLSGKLPELQNRVM